MAQESQGFLLIPCGRDMYLGGAGGGGSTGGGSTRAAAEHAAEHAAAVEHAASGRAVGSGGGRGAGRLALDSSSSSATARDAGRFLKGNLVGVGPCLVGVVGRMEAGGAMSMSAFGATADCVSALWLVRKGEGTGLGCGVCLSEGGSGTMPSSTGVYSAADVCSAADVTSGTTCSVPMAVVGGTGENADENEAERARATCMPSSSSCHFSAMRALAPKLPKPSSSASSN